MAMVLLKCVVFCVYNIYLYTLFTGCFGSAENVGFSAVFVIMKQRVCVPQTALVAKAKISLVLYHILCIRPYIGRRVIYEVLLYWNGCFKISFVL